MFIRFVLLLGLMAAPLSARAADLILVVGFAAGGTSSAAARAILEPLSRASGRRVAIESRAGAGGLLAAQHVARQPAESSTLLFMSSSSSLRVPTDLGLVPVALVATYDYVVAGRGRWPTLAAHLAAAKHEPFLQTVATPGAGSFSHLSTARIFREHGVAINHVPTLGGAPAVTAVLGGHVALAAVPYPDFLGFKDALRILAQSGAGLAVTGWIGVFAPSGTSAADVARLAAWFKTASQEAQEPLARIGFTAAYAPGAELARMHAKDREEYLPELKQQGVAF